ncbi:CCAAT/enhancer-binding protein zeta [Microplitis mediator]|uniref:CCAAT/enhancer-binding protein zeta n=1 Tax=Microplitis mediator TaxID=375433 RepID=UPI00255253E4|nr:CCAAT/enhancer-binding protein zeta [Microplitis mediator]XP_057318017.1 CCAAT/enhancer-binding protein zeta [Microplitis mediator]XP_057318018.1 CCAAT/enhancer-binding protein zeta [Microplitis mediator]
MIKSNSNETKWYSEFPKESKPCKHSRSDVEVIKLKEDAKKHLDAETAGFQMKKSTVRDSEYNWLKTAASSGTNADKIGANILFIQENPKYNLSRLINLVSQVKGSRHSHSNLLITSLRDLFLSDLLHPQYKLLKFEEQNLDKIASSNQSTIINRDGQTKKLLAYWYFEDQLREQYEKFITYLSAVASDTIDTNREKAISIMTDLLIGNSEQEHQLLSLLVNKIGDPKSKVASKVIFCLNNLLLEHPNMKIIVLRELEKLLFRKNINHHAQYYAISLLTQFVLSREDSETATNLIDVYFAFFKACLKKGEPDSKMMAAILTGVNRAYHFANKETIKINDHIDSVYKVVHVGSFNVSLNALSLLYQIVENDVQQERRFYTALYGKLLDPQIGSAKKGAVFLNLLFKAMKNDKSVTRLYTFVKRVLQICSYFPACMICATLYIILQILQSRKDLKQILFKSTVPLKTEDNENEDKNNDDNEEETEEKNKSTVKNNGNKKTQANIMLPNVIFDSTSTDDTNEKSITDIKIEQDNTLLYDPFSINPLKSGAIKSPVVELIALSNHFHPSVALFARNIIEGKVINYTGDPLEDLTLIRFLDRYVFKNPKKLEEKKVKSNDPLSVRAKYIPKGIRSVPVDSHAYLNEKEERIPVDELFLYRYLNKKNEIKNIVKKEDDDSDNDSVNSEEFNYLLDKLNGDKDFEELDIAGDLGSFKKNKKRPNDESDDDSDNEQDDDDEIVDDFDEDESMNDEDFENMSDMDVDDDDDASDMEFIDDDDNDNNSALKQSVQSVLKKNKNLKYEKKKLKNKIDDNVFMSAEKFAEILEQQGRSKQKEGSSNVMSDVDGASVKQLDWEIKRNKKISGKFGGTKKSKFTKSGTVSRKNVKKFKKRN